MLGGFLLAAPFVLLAGSVYIHQIVWMALLLSLLWRWEGPHAALIVGLLFTASAHTRLMVPNQADNWIVAVATFLTAWWGWRAMRSGSPLSWWSSAVFFGAALSYRFILWVAVVPLAVFLVRDLGWARAARWMSVAGAVTVLLSFGPLIWVRDSYMAGPVAMASNKTPDAVPGATSIVALVTLVVLALSSIRVRSWPHVWIATACTLAAMVAAIFLIQLPSSGVVAIATYQTVAYNGTFLILGLVGLAVGRTRPDSHSPKVTRGREVRHLSSRDGNNSWRSVRGVQTEN